MPDLKPIHQHVRVDFRYNVRFTHHLFAPDNPIFWETLVPNTLDSSAKFLLVVDDKVYEKHPTLLHDIEIYVAAHAGKLKLVGQPIIVPGGEQSKNELKHIQTITDAVNDFHIDRHSYIVAIGGGAVIDMAGYAAGISHRGVRIVRVPTTVLAQNDAAVGVKNAVNAYSKKNFLGTFVPPHAVLNDFEFLCTLEQRDWMAGVSEAIKVALLKDATFFDYIADHADDLVTRDMDAMAHVIHRCAELHLEHIATSGDPFEFGSSRPLDFGHWAAHKLEQQTDYELRHGEAVAIGIALDTVYSHLTGRLDEANMRRVLDTFAALDFALYIPELEQTNADGVKHVYAGLNEFREHLGGILTIMLLEGIGHGVEVNTISQPTMDRAIALLREYTPRRKNASIVTTC